MQWHETGRVNRCGGHKPNKPKHSKSTESYNGKLPSIKLFQSAVNHSLDVIFFNLLNVSFSKRTGAMYFNLFLVFLEKSTRLPRRMLGFFLDIMYL